MGLRAFVAQALGSETLSPSNATETEGNRIVDVRAAQGKTCFSLKPMRPVGRHPHETQPVGVATMSSETNTSGHFSQAILRLTCMAMGTRQLSAS